MKTRLGGLVLPQVQEIATCDRRALVEQKAPGMAGSQFQNMGRHPTGIMLWGVATGPKARDFVEKLEGNFQAAKPLPFAADIVAGARIAKVFISDLRIQDLAGKPERFAYALVLSEFIKPKVAQDHTALNNAIRADAHKQVAKLTTALTKLKK